MALWGILPAAALRYTQENHSTSVAPRDKINT
jgi:hypothetical protein